MEPAKVRARHVGRECSDQQPSNGSPRVSEFISSLRCQGEGKVEDKENKAQAKLEKRRCRFSATASSGWEQNGQVQYLSRKPTAREPIFTPHLSSFLPHVLCHGIGKEYRRGWWKSKD